MTLTTNLTKYVTGTEVVPVFIWKIKKPKVLKNYADIYITKGKTKKGQGLWD